MEGAAYEYIIEEQSLRDIIGYRKVKTKLKGWKKEQDLIELFTRVYILDKGYRKIMPPFVKSDINGNTEILKKEWINNEWDGTFKLRCFMLTKLVIPGYFELGRAASAELKGVQPEFYIDGEPDVCNFEKFFGKSYQQLVEYMEEFSYHRETGDMYTLNFYEI